jgi:hypothetical protein
MKKSKKSSQQIRAAKRKGRLKAKRRNQRARAGH